MSSTELGLNAGTILTLAVLFILALPGLGFFAWQIHNTLRDGGGARTDMVQPVDVIPAAFLANMYLLLWVLQLIVWLAGTNNDPPEGLPHFAMLVQLVILMMIVGTIFIIIRWRDRKLGYFFGLDQASWRITLSRAGFYLLCAAFPLALILVSWNFILSLIDGVDLSPQDVVWMFVNSTSWVDKMVLTVFAVVIAPITEELIFRGYLHQVTKRYLGFIPAILLVSALFALIHFSLPAIVPLFVLAIILTLAYERTGSIITPIVMHATFNGFMIAQMWMIDPSQLPG